MAIEQVAFYIPPDIKADLAAGLLHRFGGVVRNSQGHIVSHLREIPLPPESQQAAAKKTIAIAGVHKGLVAAGLAVTGIVVGGLIYFAARNRSDSASTVDRYEASLAKYLEAIQAGTLDASTVTQLIDDLDAVRSLADNGAIIVDFTTEPSATLVNLVVEYTRQLADANGVNLTGPDRALAASKVSTISRLRSHLGLQQRIFNEAA